MQKKLSIGISVAILTFGALTIIGPRPIGTATEITGDPSINLDPLTQHGIVTSFVMTKNSVRFSGRGGDENTDVEIGSVTKTMTAEIARKQVERGELSWSTPIGSMLDLGNSEAASITIDELINHTSGLSRNHGLNLEGLFRMLAFNGNPDDGVTADVVINAAKNATLKKRGTKQYSNFGYGLLSLALAKNANLTQQEMFNKDVFTPAGMTDSYLAVPGSVPKDATLGVAMDGRESAPWDSDGLAGAGSVRSTAKDMAAYAKYVMESGDLSRSWIFSEEENAYWHNGATGGFSSMMILDPDTLTATWINSASANSPEDTAFSIFQEARG